MEAENAPVSWVDGYQIRHPKKKAFLAAYAQLGVISKACDLVGIDRQTQYNWRKREHDEQEAYCLAFADAQERAIETLENELYRRAMAGSCDQASMTGLIFALKALRPNVYRERINVQTSDVSGVENVDLAKWSDEEIATIKALLAKGQSGPTQ